MRVSIGLIVGLLLLTGCSSWSSSRWRPDDTPGEYDLRRENRDSQYGASMTPKEISDARAEGHVGRP
jgi:hypothetical protein